MYSSWENIGSSAVFVSCESIVSELWVNIFAKVSAILLSNRK
jgi:hypothetical protein